MVLNLPSLCLPRPPSTKPVLFKATTPSLLHAALSLGKLREIKVFYLLPDYTLSKMKAWGEKKALCSSVKLAKRVRIKML